MLQRRSFACIIPAKGISTRVPGKNMQVCDGYPLVAYPFKIAQEAGIFDTMLLSTDSREILDYAKLFSYDYPYLRPDELATPESKVWDAVRDMLTYIELNNPELVTDFVCLLHPTNPCLKPQSVRAAMSAMLRSRFFACSSFTKVSPYTTRNLKKMLFRGPKDTRYDHPCYCLNGAITACRWRDAVRLPDFWLLKYVYPYITPPSEAIDIDTYEDLETAEAILQWRRTHVKPEPPTEDGEPPTETV